MRAVTATFQTLPTLKSCCQCRRTSSIAAQLHAAQAASNASSSRPDDDSAAPSTSIQGWVRSFRKQKAVTFAVVSDGSNVNGVQAVVPKDQAQDLSNGCAVTMHGQVVDSPGKKQLKEFQADSVEVVGSSVPETYPITNTKQGIPPQILRHNAHLRSRTRATGAMLRLRSAMTFAVHEQFQKRDFLHVQTPLITSSDCEGAGEVFRVVSDKDKPSKGKQKADGSEKDTTTPRYLTVSSQLHLEAIASSTPRVYTLSPAFRAEMSDTARHLQEFWMLESEESFLSEHPPDALKTVMDGVEATVQGVLSHVLESKHEDLAFFDAQTPGLLDSIRQAATSPYARITYSEAISLLRDQYEKDKASFAFEPAHGRSIQTEHEKFLAEQAFKGPVFVTDYPASQKPWYMLPSSLDGPSDTVACFDLLVPRLGELVGGSLREHRHEHLVSAMKRHGVSEKQYEWYLDLRKYGSTPHGGWGLGWERLIAFISGLDNVRDCIAFPRASEGSRF